MNHHIFGGYLIETSDDEVLIKVSREYPFSGPFGDDVNLSLIFSGKCKPEELDAVLHLIRDITETQEKLFSLGESLSKSLTEIGHSDWDFVPKFHNQE